MTGGPLAPWHSLCGDFKKLAKKIVASTSVNINSEPLREEVKTVARLYMHEARPIITRQGFEEDLNVLNDHFKKLYELADARNATASYKRQINAVRKVLPGITTRLEMEVGTVNDGPVHTAIEIQIAETLEYKQRRYRISKLSAIWPTARAFRFEDPPQNCARFFARCWIIMLQMRMLKIARGINPRKIRTGRIGPNRQ